MWPILNWVVVTADGLSRPERRGRPRNRPSIEMNGIFQIRPMSSATLTAPDVQTPPPPSTAPAKPPPSPVLAPADPAEYNRLGLDYRRPMPRPKVRGAVIDSHCHLLAARHAGAWFEAADHYGIDCFLTMTPLEEAVGLQRQWGHRLRFIAVPRWGDDSAADWADNWLHRAWRRSTTWAAGS